MKRSLHWLFSIVFFLILMLSPSLVQPALATEVEETAPASTEAAEVVQAVDISHSSLVTSQVNWGNWGYLFDKDQTIGRPYKNSASLTLTYEEGIGSLYIIFCADYGTYTITDNTNGTEYVREDAFLHDYVDLEAVFGYAPTSVTLSFSDGYLYLSEMYVYTPGEVPDFVQKWEAPGVGKTDLILFSTHADDEHLFFAGILPYYAKELGYQVQLVYFTDHYNLDAVIRQREMLDGLWAVGVTTYPIMGHYEDFLKDTKEETYAILKMYDHTQEDMIGFVVEQLRRFQPKVVIGHDFGGEYGHGEHMVYAEVLSMALEVSMNPEKYPESAEAYGVWDVPKAYFHLYKENPIVMDWDQPLESFDGMTPFEVSIRIGFQQHKSQIQDFAWYYRDADKATDVASYGPCDYGLYRSTVGADVEKNDFFENIYSYGEEEALEAQRLAEEEAARIAAEEEAARLAAEEEAARIAAEQEAARLAAEEEAARIAGEIAAEKNKNAVFYWAAAIALVIIAIPLANSGTKKDKEK